MMSQEQMGKIVAGKEAQFLLNQLSPFLDQVRKSQIDKMKVSFRSNTSDDLTIKVCAGILCALEDLEDQISRYIRQGNQIERKQHDDTRSNDTTSDAWKNNN